MYQFLQEVCNMFKKSLFLLVCLTLLSTTAFAQNQNVPHDSPDYGAPLKTGSKSYSTSLPTPVTEGDRANNISDSYGRTLTTDIPIGVQIWKSFTATTTQTGAAIWTPAAGKKIAVQYCQLSSYGTVAARAILWFGGAADTTYTEGTDQPLFKGRFISTTTVTTVVVANPSNAIYSSTADNILRITTDAASSIDVVCYGYEF